MIGVICGFELNKYEVDGGIRADNKDDFHRGVISRYECGEKIHISCGKHKCKQDLAFSRKSYKMGKFG